MQLAEGKIIAERFRLVRELGVGGMGSVWLAHHVGLDTPCAVKFINAEVVSQADMRARFEREAKAAAALRSSHVVQILDYGVWENFPYIAMEYLEGEDLAQRIKRRGRLTAKETVLIISQVARALTKAHAAGLIHRDLKPENIFLVPEDDHEIAKVLDFGIAKSHGPLLDMATTKAGALLGTPHYMSPEQAQGTKTIDYRSDLWSLGVLAFQCMTGKLPFNSEALGDLLLHIMVNPLPVPSQLAADVPQTFDIWWQRAAARDPAQRFQSAKELADSLAVALGLTVALMPGMVPFSQLGSGLFVVSGTPSLPSITPPGQPSAGGIQIQPPTPSGPHAMPAVSAAISSLDFGTGNTISQVPPTTGAAVSLDEQRPAEPSQKRAPKVPLALGISVGVFALIAGIGIAFLGRSYLQNGGQPTVLVATAPTLIPSVPIVLLQAPPSASPTAPGAETGDSTSSPSASGSAGTNPAASASSKLPLKPTAKPKEPDFGF